MLTKAFPLLFLLAWGCVAALVKWEARWLYLLLGLAVIVGLWAGRRQSVFLRVMLLLALVFPAWKKGDRWRHWFATRQNAAQIGDDAGLIRALVADEETYLVLCPKMSALS